MPAPSQTQKPLLLDQAKPKLCRQNQSLHGTPDGIDATSKSHDTALGPLGGIDATSQPQAANGKDQDNATSQLPSANGKDQDDATSHPPSANGKDRDTALGPPEGVDATRPPAANGKEEDTALGSNAQTDNTPAEKATQSTLPLTPQGGPAASQGAQDSSELLDIFNSKA